MSFRISIAVACFLALGISATDAEDHVTRVSSADKAACMPDALKLCRDAVPNVYRVLLCFGKHRDKLSDGCRAVLASYGL
jgi:hypothetical protein